MSLVSKNIKYMWLFVHVPLRSAVVDKMGHEDDILSFSCLFTYDVTQSAACTAG